jgi:dephospho-CoA kinase
VITKVGLTGLNAAGKGTVAQILQKYGYSYFSLSDIVREEALEQGLELTRENLIQVGNAMRQKRGPGILARLIMERLENKSVIDSIRNPEEINELRTLEDFILLGIRADDETRFRRMKQRGRTGDAETFEQFKHLEEKEMGSSSASQQLHVCLEMADHYLDNNSTVEALEQKLFRICGIA